MNSLEVGKEIHSLLTGNQTLANKVENKIYPVICETTTSFPFIVYKRSNITPLYTKDYHTEDSVIIDIYIMSTDYA